MRTYRDDPYEYMSSEPCDYCSCRTCKHWGENGTDPSGEEDCPLDPFCIHAGLYEKKEGDSE